jgi:large subunit ribosomal protein L37Ae
MVKTKKVKAAGRFGARYGRSVRRKIAEIESVQRKKQTCLFCNGVAKRLSKGIWQCKKCKKKFASHTYHLNKPKELNK